VKGRLRWVALVLPLLVAAASTAQDVDAPDVVIAPPAPSRSALGAFLARRGSVVVEHRKPQAAVPLADGGTVRVEPTWAFEPGLEHQRLLGLRVQVEAEGLEGDAGVAYLDLHEIEALVRAMAFMEDTGGVPSGGVAEAWYVSLEGFGVGSRVRDGATEWFVRAGSDEPVRAAISTGSFRLLRQRLSDARERLFSP
jgi:hypothetical protein